MAREGSQDENPLLRNNEGNCDFIERSSRGWLMPGLDNGQDKQSGCGEIRAAHKR